MDQHAARGGFGGDGQLDAAAVCFEGFEKAGRVDGEPRLVEDHSSIWISAGAAVGELTPRRRTANSTC
jgi:hypothetical protein